MPRAKTKSIPLSERLIISVASMYTLRLEHDRECAVVDMTEFVSHWYMVDLST
jgi:hypothetical protein